MKAVSLVVFVTAVFGLVWSPSNVSAAQTCDMAAGEASCAVCAAGADSNTLSTVPRVDRTFASQPSDLGQYNWFKCVTEADGDRRCDMKTLTPAEGAKSEGDPEAYIDSVAIYLALPFLMFILVILFTGCLITWRYLCCCCCTRTGTCKCGAKFPTRRRCCFGYTNDQLSKPRYPRTSRLCSFLGMLVFVGSSAAFIALGDLKGNEGVTTAMKAVADAPTGIMSLATGVMEPVMDLYSDVISSTIPTFIRDVNATIHDSVNLKEVSEDMTCIVDHITNIPDVDAIDTFLSNLNSSLVDVKAEVKVIDNALVDIIAATDDIRGNVTDLETLYTGLNDGLSNVRNNITALNNAVTAVDDTQTTIVDPTTGAATVLGADITALDTNWPAASDITDVTTSASGSISRLTNGDMDGAGNEAERTTLLNRLTTLHDTFLNQLPNGTDIAFQMRRYNQAVDDMQTAGTVSTLLTAVSDMQAAVAALPSASSINDSITLLVASVDALTVTPVSNALVAINSTITDLPRFAILQTELAKIKAMASIIPCLDRAIGQLLGLNNTVVSLPDGIEDLLDLPKTVNDTIWPAIEEIDRIDADLTTAQTAIDDANIDSYITDVSKMDGDLATAKANLNVDDMRASLASMESDTSVDYSVTSDIESFNATLVENTIGTSAITAAESWETLRVSLYTQLGTAVSDVTVYDQGYCSDDNAVTCSADGDCGGTCDGIGTRRCEDSPTTACTQDSDCTGRCLVDSTRFGTLSTTLQGASKPDFSSVSSAMSAVDTAGGYSLSTITSDLAGAQSAIDGVDVSGFETALSDAKTSLDSFDTSSVESTLDDVLANVDGVDFDAMDAQIEDVKGTVQDIEDKQADIDDAHGMAKAMVAYIYDGRLDAHLEQLSPTAMAGARGAGGLAVMVVVVAGVIDDASLFFSNYTTLTGEPTTFVPDLMKETDLIEKLNILTTDMYSQYGPLHFLASLADKDIMDPANVYVKGMVQDRNGIDYPDDKLCLSQDCVYFTIDEMNNDNLDGVTKGALPVTLSRVNLFRATYIFPAIVVVLGALSLLCCVSCKSRPKCQKIAPSCMTGCILIQLPWIFLFSGILFAITLLVGDVCYGGANVGFQYVGMYGDKFCEDALGGTGTLSACTISMDVGSQEVNTTLNLPAVYSGVLGACPASDPLAPAYDTVKQEVATLPRDELDDMLEDMDGDVTLREALKNDLRRAADSLGTNAETFVTGMSNAADCEALNGAMLGMKEAMCCDVLSALYWIVSSWYLLAWGMCVCGIPAGLCGRKRLASRPWGPAYEEDLRDNPIVGQVAIIKAREQAARDSEYDSQGVDHQSHVQPLGDDLGYGYGNADFTHQEYADYEGEERPKSRQAW